MNTFLIAGAVLAVGVALAHSYLGERYILIRLFRRADLPRLFGGDAFTRQTLRFAWHLTSIAWWGFAALLWIYAREAGSSARREALLVIAVTFLMTTVLTFGFSRGRHLAWIVFLAIAASAWLGMG